MVKGYLGWIFWFCVFSFCILILINLFLGEDGRTSPKQQTVVFPFDRNSERSVQGVSELERKQFNSLNIHSSFDNDPLSPRARSFPTTPEQGARPISPLTLGSSLFGKSRSLTSLASSRTDMRFSRHMVSGSDGGDIEV